MPKVTIDNRGIVTEAGTGFHIEGQSMVEEIQEVTVATTETATLKPYGTTSLTTTGGASGVITLPDGTAMGQQKFVVLTGDGGDATLRVTTHETSTPEDFTGADPGDAILFVWQGTQWATVANSGWAT